MKITVDAEKCIGCGTCPALCPNVFKMNEGNKAVIIDLAGDTIENIKMAADACPTQAIIVEE
ncbi:MAG: ferredoxin [Patescibacteria group bacterium]